MQTSELRIWSSQEHHCDLPLRLCSLPGTLQEAEHQSPLLRRPSPVPISVFVTFLPFLPLSCCTSSTNLDFWNQKRRQEVCCTISIFQLPVWLGKGRGSDAREDTNINISKKVNPSEGESEICSLRGCSPYHQPINNDWTELLSIIPGIFYQYPCPLEAKGNVCKYRFTSAENFMLASVKEGRWDGGGWHFQLSGLTWNS